MGEITEILKLADYGDDCVQTPARLRMEHQQQ